MQAVEGITSVTVTLIIAVIVAAFVGIVSGVIVNWLADNLPHHFRLNAPRYPDDSPRPVIAWSGLGAWLTGRRASPNGAKLSVRYPLVELVLALLFAYIAAAFPLSGRSVVWMINIAILMLVTVIDLEHRLILFVVIIPACVFALVGNFLTGELAQKQDYLIGGVIGFGLFLLMYLGGILFSVIVANARGEELDEVAFGYGDVMLATLAGLILGWQAFIFAMFITVFAGAAGAILFLGIRLIVRGKYEMFTALPYGQYIVLGTLIMMIWREPVRTFLQGR